MNILFLHVFIYNIKSDGLINLGLLYFVFHLRLSCFIILPSVLKEKKMIIFIFMGWPSLGQCHSDFLWVYVPFVPSTIPLFSNSIIFQFWLRLSSVFCILFSSIAIFGTLCIFAVCRWSKSIREYLQKCEYIIYARFLSRAKADTRNHFTIKTKNITFNVCKYLKQHYLFVLLINVCE